AAAAYLADLTDLGPRETLKEFFVEARYRGQVWELDVPLRRSQFTGEGDVRELEEDFHETHERVFAVREPGQHLECLLWKARATAALQKPELRSREFREGEAEPIDRTTVFFQGTGA